MAITNLPTPPSRSDPENFAERADAFMAALPRFANEANALQQDVTQSAENAGDAASAAGSSASAAGSSRDAAAASADAAASSQQGAAQKAAESRDSAALARQWATKLGEPVDSGEFSARHYAQLAAQGMGLPIFPATGIPTSNVGPIYIAGVGAAEWNPATADYRTSIGFALVYPGGTAAAPGVLNGNSQQIVDNPFPGYAVHVEPEHEYLGQWFNPGWYCMLDRTATPDWYFAWGIRAFHNPQTDKIVVTSGKNGTCTVNSNLSGGSYSPTMLPQNQVNARFRLKVWKLLGKNNG